MPAWQSLAGYVSGDDEQAAVGRVGNDLIEVAADFARRPIFVLNRQPG